MFSVFLKRAFSQARQYAIPTSSGQVAYVTSNTTVGLSLRQCHAVVVHFPFNLSFSPFYLFLLFFLPSLLPTCVAQQSALGKKATKVKVRAVPPPAVPVPAPALVPRATLRAPAFVPPQQRAPIPPPRRRVPVDHYLAYRTRDCVQHYALVTPSTTEISCNFTVMESEDGYAMPRVCFDWLPELVSYYTVNRPKVRMQEGNRMHSLFFPY